MKFIQRRAPDSNADGGSAVKAFLHWDMQDADCSCRLTHLLSSSSARNSQESDSALSVLTRTRLLPLNFPVGGGIPKLTSDFYLVLPSSPSESMAMKQFPFWKGIDCPFPFSNAFLLLLWKRIPADQATGAYKASGRSGTLAIRFQSPGQCRYILPASPSQSFEVSRRTLYATAMTSRLYT